MMSATKPTTMAVQCSVNDNGKKAVEILKELKEVIDETLSDIAETSNSTEHSVKAQDADLSADNECSYFLAMENNSDSIMDHPSYNYYCSKRTPYHQIIPYFHCRKCKHH